MRLALSIFAVFFTFSSLSKAKVLNFEVNCPSGPLKASLDFDSDFSRWDKEIVITDRATKRPTWQLLGSETDIKMGEAKGHVRIVFASDNSIGSLYSIKSTSERVSGFSDFYDEESKTLGSFTVIGLDEKSLSPILGVRFESGVPKNVFTGNKTLVLCGEDSSAGNKQGNNQQAGSQRPVLKSGLYGSLDLDTAQASCDAFVDASNPAQIYINAPGSKGGKRANGCEARGILKFLKSGTNYYHESSRGETSMTVRLTVLDDQSFEEYISIVTPIKTIVFRKKNYLLK